MVKPFDFTKLVKEHNKAHKVVSGFNDPITWIDTGNYALNKMISGDFRKGIPLGCVTVFAGESGSAKSFLVSGNIIRDALAQGIFVVAIDSEDALKKKWMENLNVDVNHPNLVRYVKNLVNEVVDTINDFTKEYRETYLNTPREEQPKILFVIDSLGFLDTEKAKEQFEKGDIKGDMGIKAKALKALVSQCIRLFAGFEIGLVATNHTYKSQDMFNPDDVISGGCLVANTKIQMADGTFKNIQDVNLDESVKTMYGDEKITHLWHYKKPTVYLELEDGTQIECSKEHKFLVEKEEGHLWVEAEKISENDNILSM
jgi:RecA/RadA recombinase